MTREDAMWWVFGWLAGILSLMQIQVWRPNWEPQGRKKKEDRNVLVNPNFIPRDERLQDWDPAELDPIPHGSLFAVKPRMEPKLDPKPVVMQECPHCGRAFKRVSQHIRMAHPTPSDLPVEPEVGVDE